MPARTRTVRVAESYSPVSLSAASVITVLLAPVADRIDPGTKLVPAGMVSLSTADLAGLPPRFSVVTV